MPYANKELKSEYQKRTATPYMKKWRERNREHHRKYIREWKRKRYAIPEKKEMDLSKYKKSECYKRALKNAVINWRIKVKKLHDLYIVGLLVRRGKLTREAVYANPEIINITRDFIIIHRKLKENDNNNNKLIRHETSLERELTRVTNREKKTISGKRSE